GSRRRAQGERRKAQGAGIRGRAQGPGPKACQNAEMSPAEAPPRSAWVAWLVVCVVWGTTYLAIRIALETIPPFLMTAFRWTTAGATILVFLKIRGEKLPGVRQWPGLAILGILLMGFGNGGVVWAEQTIPSGL